MHMQRTDGIGKQNSKSKTSNNNKLWQNKVKNLKATLISIKSYQSKPLSNLLKWMYAVVEHICNSKHQQQQQQLTTQADTLQVIPWSVYKLQISQISCWYLFGGAQMPMQAMSLPKSGSNQQQWQLCTKSTSKSKQTTKKLLKIMNCVTKAPTELGYMYTLCDGKKVRQAHVKISNGRLCNNSKAHQVPIESIV